VINQKQLRSGQIQWGDDQFALQTTAKCVGQIRILSGTTLFSED